jgi:hypothetical protein
MLVHDSAIDRAVSIYVHMYDFSMLHASGVQATVAELAEALVSHPLYGDMLAAADGVSKASLAADR